MTEISAIDINNPPQIYASNFQKSVSPYYVLTSVRIPFIVSFFMITVLATDTIINYVVCPVAVTGVITTASFIFYNHKVNFLSIVKKKGEGWQIRMSNKISS
jgi:hypothetical protein